MEMNLSNSVRRIAVASSHIVLLNPSELHHLPQSSKSSTDPSSLNHFLAFLLYTSRELLWKSCLRTSTTVMPSVRRYVLASAALSSQSSLASIGSFSSMIPSSAMLFLYGPARRLFRRSRGAWDCAFVVPPGFII